METVRSRNVPGDATPTASRILDVAERLVQKRGFNGFSYADVAQELDITKASLHYHFASKAELGTTLIDRYASRFAEALQGIDSDGGDAGDKLTAYAAIYAGVLRERRMCLCGMLAADYETLPESMQEAVVRFFEENEAWLAGVIEHGAERGELRPVGSPPATAHAVVSSLEGAMLVARPDGNVDRFVATADQLLATLTPTGGEPEGPARRFR